jgi:predicted nucleic acid-binding protein
VTVVVDASVLVVALTDDGSHGIRARARLRGERLLAPELIDLEVASVVRRLCRSGRLAAGRAGSVLTDLAGLGFERVSHRPLLPRCWELRENLTPYDAAYVAVAEAFDAPLLTADARLAAAPGLRCTVEVLRGEP